MKKQRFLPSLLLFILSHAYMHSLTVDEVMTDEQAKSMGLNHMSQEQQNAFSSWLEEWTKKVLQEAPTYHASQPISSWVQQWPIFLRPRANMQSPQVLEALKEANQKIFRNMNGDKIELMDGSIWRIVSFDRFTTKIWRRGDAVKVEKSLRDTMRPYMITNLRTDEIVGASMDRAASPTEEHPQNPPEYFEGAVEVTSMDKQMGRVTLSDGSRWKIAPVDQIKIQTNWQPKDRIRVTSSNDYLYSYMLHNLDSGDSVLAIKMK